MYRSNDSKNYADKTYWDERYQKADPGCAEDQVYEWYLDFEHIKGFMLDDINKIGVKQPHIMVSGCGNSTFCEDLCNLGANYHARVAIPLHVRSYST